jgi:hypothetical protein
MDRQEIILGYIWSNFWLRYQPVGFKIDISYGEVADAKIHIRHCGYHFNEDDKRIGKEDFVFVKWNAKELPFLKNSDAGEVITFKEGSCTINPDIIASAFYFLSGWQELHAATRDQFDRYRFQESIQFNLGIAHLPVVNYYFDILKAAIEYVYAVKLRLRKKAPFNVILSHDIDELDTLWLQEGFHALKKGKVLALPELAAARITGSDVSASIKRMLQLNEQYHIKSDFFFLCSNSRAGIYKNADYDVKNKKIIAQIHAVIEAGNEICIHGSFHTHHSAENLKNDKALLENICKTKISGNRFHFLSFGKETTDVLAESAIVFDSTLGFAEHTGFRNSYADPFYLFNHHTFSTGSTIEFPLAVMDASLYFKQYMNLDYEQSLRNVLSIIKEVSKVEGTLVINWHNTGYLKYKNSWLLPLLNDIIKECIGSDAAFVTMDECCSEIKSKA